MLNQFLQRLILSQLVEAGREAIHHPPGPHDERAKELMRIYWDLVYWYKFGIPKFPETQIQLPRFNEMGPLTTDTLELHQELLFYLLDAYAGDPSPQPSLQSLLLDRSTRLAAAREVALLFERGHQSMKEEITRLEQESKVK
jgi:hypothetical protein